MKAISDTALSASVRALPVAVIDLDPDELGSISAGEYETAASARNQGRMKTISSTLKARNRYVIASAKRAAIS